MHISKVIRYGPRVLAWSFLVFSNVIAFSVTLESRGLPNSTLTSVDARGDTIWALAQRSAALSGNEQEGPNTLVYRSLDGGQNWTSFPLDDTDNPFEIRFISDDVGFVMANDRLYRTGDGGVTWELEAFIGASAPVGFYENGDGDLYVMYLNRAYISQDEGLTWESFLSGNAPVEITFVASDVGYMALGGQIYKTSNAGETYQLVFNPSVVYGGITFLHFFDRNRGIAMDGRNVYRTTNGGSSWTIVNDELEALDLSGNISDMEFVDDQRGLLSGNHIYRTTDGGVSWDQVTFGAENRFRGLSRVPGTERFVVVGSDGNVLELSVDGEVEDDYYLSSPAGETVFVDGQRGWGIGLGTVFQTTNGGGLWRQVDLPNLGSREVTGLVKASSDTLIVCGTEGGLWKLVIDEEDWEFLDTGLEANLFHLEFVNKNEGWVVGWQKSLEWKYYSTRDGGTSWQEMRLPEGARYLLVERFDAKAGWAFDLENLWYTSNGGDSWQMREVELGGSLSNPTLVRVIPVGHRSVLVQLTEYDLETAAFVFEWRASFDAGLSWVPLDSLLNESVLEVGFMSPCYGYALGSKLRITKDGGRTWTENEELEGVLGQFGPFRDLSFLDWGKFVLLDSRGRTLFADLEQNQGETVAFSEVGIERPYPLTLNFQSEVGARYLIEKSYDLELWERDCDLLIATSELTEWVDADMEEPEQMARFYRVIRVSTEE